MILIHKSTDEQLIIGLNRARNTWQNKKYSTVLDKTKVTNNINRIDLILDTYKFRGYLSERQKEKAKELIENSNRKERY